MDIQDRLRQQFKELEMKGLPWMEDQLLNLDEYYVDLTMQRQDKRGRDLPTATIKIEEILASYDGEEIPTRVLIEGGPGLGKSTLAAKLAYDWANNESYMKHFDLVLLIPLRHFVGDLEETILCATSISRKDSKYLCNILNDKSKNFLFILDGYDEASFKTETSVFPLLKNDLFSHVFVVVTSRPGKFPSKRCTLKPGRSASKSKGLFDSADFTPTFSCFIDRRVCIKGFTSEQQDMFMKKHLSSYTEEEQLKVRSKLAKIMDKEFLKCPLFLLMLIVVLTNSSEEQKPSVTITDIYKNVFIFVIRRYFSKISDLHNVDFDIFSSDSKGKDCQLLIAQFGNFALQAIQMNTLSFSYDDISKLENFDIRILELGFLTPSVCMMGFREKLFYEPVHKSLLEFAAAFAVWLSFNNNNDGVNWKEKAISLRPRIDQFQSKQLCFPFLAGLLGTKAVALYTVLCPYAVEYSTQFGLLSDTLLETLTTDEVLNSLKPFLPIEWLAPWPPFENGFSTSLQYEAAVRSGALEGRIKLVQWDMRYPVRLPNDVELETVICDMLFNSQKPQLQAKTVRCKNLWLTVNPFLSRDVFKVAFLHILGNVSFQHISLHFTLMPNWFDVVNKTVALKNLQILWLKTMSLLKDKKCNYLLSKIVELIAHDKIKRLTLILDGNYPQKYVDALIKCAGKSSFLDTFILRSNGMRSTFSVDLHLLCDGGRKSWNWLQLEGIKVDCSRISKTPVHIHQLDLGSSWVSQRAVASFQCSVAPALTIKSSLVATAFSVWNLGDSLAELNIVLEPSFLDDGLQIVLSKHQNLKVLVLTIAVTDDTVHSHSVTELLTGSHMPICLRRLEIWKVEVNPLLAKEIVDCVTGFHKVQLHSYVQSHGRHQSTYSVTPIHSPKSLDCILLNTPLVLENEQSEMTSSKRQHFTSLVLCIKQCLMAKSLHQLEIVHIPQVLFATLSARVISWRTVFPADEGFKLEHDLWGSRQQDSVQTKAMFERSPGLLHRFTITYEPSLQS